MDNLKRILGFPGQLRTYDFPLIAVAMLSVLVLTTNWGAANSDACAKAWAAAYSGDIRLLSDAIANCRDLNKNDREGRSILTVAIQENHAAAVDLLLKKGANPNADEGKGLLAAAGLDRLDILRNLVAAGANINAQPEDLRESALGVACQSRNLKMAQYLCDHGANPNLTNRLGWSPLMFAASRDVKIVRLLLSRGANVQQRDLNGCTALFDACEAGQLDAVRLLIAAGSDLSTRANDSGKTPLVVAAEHGYCRIVQLLLDNGAKPDETLSSPAGETALMRATVMGHLDVVKTLLAHGAAVNAKGEMGQTALAYAALAGDADTAQALLGHGARVDTQDANGVTALMLAAKRDDQVMAKILLAHGANSQLKNAKGEKAVDIARLHHAFDVEAVLANGER